MPDNLRLWGIGNTLPIQDRTADRPHRREGAGRGGIEGAETPYHFILAENIYVRGSGELRQAQN